MKTLARLTSCLMAFAAPAVSFDGAKAQAQDQTILGRWSGLASIDDLPQPVEINVLSLVPDAAAALEVVFEPPRSCRISARYSGFVDAHHIFRADGGGCAHMGDYADAIKIRPIAGGLKYEFSRRDGPDIGEVGYVLPLKR